MPLSRSRDLISSITTDSVCRELAACVKSRASTVCPDSAGELDLRPGERTGADTNACLRTVGTGADEDPIDGARCRRPGDARRLRNRGRGGRLGAKPPRQGRR